VDARPHIGRIAEHQGDLNGISYFKLLLDVNEPGREEIADLTGSPQFYTSSVGSQTTSVGSLGTLRNSFKSGDSVILDARVITAVVPAICAPNSEVRFFRG
jgi:hypothetical protein